ncbi:hypothetical protein ACFY1P_20445 [Streptomyces sp. NPDC001407]|uniref:hypothetical protein n=1 Tax=Streptomyces sp. NPDC001407 TaxID=3364573 RepID=UPI00368BE1AC
MTEPGARRKVPNEELAYWLGLSGRSYRQLSQAIGVTVKELAVCGTPLARTWIGHWIREGERPNACAPTSPRRTPRRPA